MPVDRVSEGDERVIEPKLTTANTAERSLLPTFSTLIDISSVIGLDSEQERDEKIYSTDSDGVYVLEGKVYYTTNGDRLANDSQLPFGFVRTYECSAFYDRLIPYFGSLKG